MHMNICSVILQNAHTYTHNSINSTAQYFSGHLKATLLEMLLGHWAHKGQGGYEMVCLTSPFPCVSLQHLSHTLIRSQFIYIALPFSLPISVTNYKWLQWDWSLWLNLHCKAHAPSRLLWSLLIITGTRLYPRLIGWDTAERKQSQNVTRWWTPKCWSGSGHCELPCKWDANVHLH